MFQKFLKALRGSYEPATVLAIVGAALLIVYALHRATGGSKHALVSFAASFDDVTGIKERSNVLFKGMPVGAVRQLLYEPQTDKILLRIEILSKTDIPANVQPFVESSLMGDSHITLKTAGQPTGKLLADVTGEADRATTLLHRINGTMLSRAETMMPGFDALASKTMTRVTELAEVSRAAVTAINEEMDSMVVAPVRKIIDELNVVIKGPEGQADKGLAAELQKMVEDLDKSAQSLDMLFKGSKDGSSKGLIKISEEFSGDFEKLVDEMSSGKDKMLSELGKVNLTLDKAEKKIGRASESIDSVKHFSDALAIKPSAIIWGMNEKQKAMLNQPPGRKPPVTGSGTK